jgi:hypothetical protein
MLVAMTLMAAGCAGGAQSQGTPVVSGQAAGSALVTCLVPGQIRQLDNNVTYLTAPRPVTTTARDCELRGGTLQRS